MHTYQAFRCGEWTGGPGKRTQPESLWQRTLQMRWSNSRKGTHRVVNMSRPDRLPRGSRGSVMRTGQRVEARVSKRFRTVAHLCVLASAFYYFGWEMTACGRRADFLARSWVAALQRQSSRTGAAVTALIFICSGGKKGGNYSTFWFLKHLPKAEGKRAVLINQILVAEGVGRGKKIPPTTEAVLLKI